MLSGIYSVSMQKCKWKKKTNCRITSVNLAKFYSKYKFPSRTLQPTLEIFFSMNNNNAKRWVQKVTNKCTSQNLHTIDEPTK